MAGSASRCPHQDFDAFIAAPETYGIDVAVEVLGQVADVVSRTYATLRAAKTVRPTRPVNDDPAANPG